MKSRKTAIIVAIFTLVLVGFGAWVFLDVPPPRPELTKDPSSEQTNPVRDRKTSESDLADKSKSTKKTARVGLTKEQRATRAALLEKLISKLAKGDTGPTWRKIQADHEQMEYLRKPIRKIRPLLKECYKHALDENPDLAGIAKIQFTIITDEEYGGLIETSQVLDEGPIAANESLNECLQETLYALMFDPPEGGGRIRVTYPLVFSSSTSPPSEVPKEKLKPVIEIANWR
ncbi:MAG: AgmX/PglI C-terminal domain-containing protein [Deltaproteobacteria bacterium]|nr:AgmX/PglI C-terminal domain-containing protein [Deltaproteobacteria bacterium]